MILAIDIGNTTIAFTGLELLRRDDGRDFHVLFEKKIPTETGKDLPLFWQKTREVLPEEVLEEKDAVTAVAISSVVPACTPAAEALAGKICSRPPTLVSWKCRTGLSFEEIPLPDRVGADRIADSAWAASRAGLPAMTVDMGTATTINIVSEERKFLGGMIGAGVRTSLRALRTGTAQLPELEPGQVLPRDLIGRDTPGCMLSAAIVGTAAMIDGIAAHVEDQLGRPLSLILTGGNAPAVSEWIRHAYQHEPNLAAKGAALIALLEQEEAGQT